MNIPFPLPPIKEQIAIVEKIQKSLSNIESLSSIIDMGLLLANRLRQSILKKAFSGRLIPSLPAYDCDSVDELPMAAEATSDYGAKRKKITLKL